MHSQYPTLFSPIKVGNVTYKNRIFQAPATPIVLQESEPYPTERYTEYYVEKAKGGSANVCVAGHIMNPNGLNPPGWHNISLRDPEHHKAWARFTDKIHFYGAKCSIEFLAFSYSGWTGGAKGVGEHFLYSINGETGPDGKERPMLTREAMEAIAEDYASCAETAMKVGFDGILIHGGHGLVIHKFLSSLWNNRTDEFGGSFENRARFPLMILDRIRERVGRKMVIEYRISGSELADVCGYPNAEDQLGPEEVARFLNLAGDRIDIAHISAGNMSIPRAEAIMHPTIFGSPRNNAYLAKRIKEIGVPQKVLTLGAFLLPEEMEETLEAGEADLIALARGTIADPQLPNKAQFGKADEIIPCIKCFNCLDHSRQQLYRCSVNPTVGREKFLREQAPRAIIPKRIAIVGGGPAGMAAAIYAAQLGHIPTIFEKSGQLGGKLIPATQASFKYDLRRFLDYQRHMIDKNMVEVRLDTEATPEMLKHGGFDAVLSAVGAEAFLPPIPGIQGDHVWIAENCYENPQALGDRVVLIGGGEIGCETALFLREHKKHVTILEMLPTLAPETFHLTRDMMLWRLEQEVDSYTGVICKEITPQGVRFVDTNGIEQTISCDTVIISAGMRPRSTLAESFWDSAPVFRAIGDCSTAKNVRTAVHTAFDAVLSISY
ncbi:MAG: FAD-dependent oxidoreductase [Faecousia sp.]